MELNSMPPSLADYARSLQDNWQRSDGDLAARSRYLQTVGRLYWQNHSEEVTATAMKIEQVEVRRIAYGLSHAHTRLVEPRDEVCTFCGQRRADVARLIAVSRAIEICPGAVVKPAR
ncbi:MAG: hypothetical protein ACR2P2_20640 [Nakamurella sp.]